MTAPSNFKLALACGTAGAYVEVTDYVRLAEPVTRSAGAKSAFEDTPPTVFAFTLSNSDGRFTPGNTVGGLATTLVEGMGATWQIHGRIVQGTIRGITPYFPSTVANTARIRITCDDDLGKLGRNDVTNLPDAALAAAGKFLLWRMDDAVGATSAVEDSGVLPLLPFADVVGGTLPATFGVAAIPGLPGTQLALASTTNESGVASNPRTALAGTGVWYPQGTTMFDYDTNSAGFWGVWITPQHGLSVRVNVYQNYLTDLFQMSYGGTGLSSNGVLGVTVGSSSDSYNLSAAENSAPFYLSMGITHSTTSSTATLYLNGVAVASATDSFTSHTLTKNDKQPAYVGVETLAIVGVANSVYVSRLSHSRTLNHEENCTTLTIAGVINAVADTTPEVTFDTLPAGLSLAPVVGGTGSGSALTKLSDAIRTEQGYVYCTTTGTLTAPVTKIKIRERTRPETVTYTFDILEILDSPEFVRSLKDTVSKVTVNGPTQSVAVANADLVPLVGSASTNETVLNTDVTDLRMYGQDRLLRGVTSTIKIASFTVDARHTATDRWADLTEMVFGDRIQVTGLPSTQLGFSTWDGWYVGVDETHDLERGLFTIYLAECSPRTAIFDTDSLMADGALTLSADIASAGATSMSVATSDTNVKLEVTTFPYTLIIDAEEVTVTACTSATPQVATITRGANGTTATTHASGAEVEVAVEALFAF